MTVSPTFKVMQPTNWKGPSSSSAVRIFVQFVSRDLDSAETEPLDVTNPKQMQSAPQWSAFVITSLKKDTAMGGIQLVIVPYNDKCKS
jgi:hypothetical protein